MVLLFYVDDFLMFIRSQYKIDDAYTSLQADFRIEDDRELKNSSHISQP